MISIVLATANPHKAEEIRATLRDLDVELLARPGNVEDVEETEDTLEGNALLKARALSRATQRIAMADDTGLFVDALDGRPGVYSARYAGESASYEDNVVKLLEEMDGREVRRARFRTVVALVSPTGKELCVSGELTGTMTTSPRGENGFGYDPVFVPDNSGERTLAEMSLEEKTRMSHRTRALQALRELLESDDLQGF